MTGIRLADVLEAGFSAAVIVLGPISLWSSLILSLTFSEVAAEKRKMPIRHLPLQNLLRSLSPIDQTRFPAEAN